MSAARPEPVRIDDYANPHFTDSVRAIRESVGPMAAELRLEAEPMMEQAVAESGLDDFGAPGFQERLDVWATAMRDEAGFAPFGVLSNHTFCVQLLKNRLLITDLLARHPEIHDIPIERHPPPQPPLRRSEPALTPLLGEPRTGPARGRATGSR